MEENDDKEDDATDKKTRKKNSIGHDNIDFDANDTGHNNDDDNDGDDNNDNNESDLTYTRVIGNCAAFMSVIFITIGELMNEQNLWAVLIIGGTLSVLNVISTSVGLEQIQREDKEATDVSADSTPIAETTTVRFAKTPGNEPSRCDEMSSASGHAGLARSIDEPKRRRTKRGGNNAMVGKREVVNRIPRDAIAIDIESTESIYENEPDGATAAAIAYSRERRRGKTITDMGQRKRVETHVVRRKRHMEKDDHGYGRGHHPSRGVRERGISKRLKPVDISNSRKKDMLRSRERRERDRQRDRERDRERERERERNRKRKRRLRYGRDYDNRYVEV